ncbi:MAG: helix-turn-helix domain-containing protein [bacterium]
MKLDVMSNEKVLEELGRRIQRERLNQNLTQAGVAAKAGVARRTLVAVESGGGGTLNTLVAILRALGVIQALDQFLPDPPLSPVQVAKLKGRERKRASGKGRHVAGVKEEGWTWGTEA